MPSDYDQRRRLAEQPARTPGATPAAIAFEATKRKLQEAVDEAVHREVAGVLSDPSASWPTPTSRSSRGYAPRWANRGGGRRAVRSSEKGTHGFQHHVATPEERELMDWLATRQPTLFKAQAGGGKRHDGGTRWEERGVHPGWTA